MKRNFHLTMLTFLLKWGQEMHLQEASERFNLDMKLLQAYAQNGLIQGAHGKDGTIDYPETAFHLAAQFCLLGKAGMDQETMKRLAALMSSERKNETEKIRLLRKCRYDLLEEIHSKQQLLDQLDYFMAEIQTKKGEKAL